MGNLGSKVFPVLLAVTGLAQAQTTLKSGLELNRLGKQLYLAAHYAEAEAVYRRALQSFDGADEQTSLNRALTLGNLGVLLRTEGRYTEAERSLSESLHQIEIFEGCETLNFAVMASNLASVYWALGELPKAEKWAQRADAVFLANLPNESLRGNRQILASIYVAERRFEDAEQLLQPLLQGASEQQAASIYNNLASVDLGRGDYARAEEHSRSAVDMARRALPAFHPVLAACLNNLAQSLRFQGHYLEAEKLYRDALSIWEQVYGPHHPDVARGLINLGAFYHEREREAGAEELYLRGAAIYEQVYGPQDFRTLAARNELADVLRAERRYTESEKLARATLPLLKRSLAPDDPVLTRAVANWSHLMADVGQAGRLAKVSQSHPRQ